MTAIEWTDTTWNPIAGCSKVSPGCKHCFAIRQATRMAGNPNPKIAGKYAPTVAGGNWTGTITVDDAALLKPLRWRTPRTVFVNSMSDLFHEHVADETIDRVLAIMAMTPQHRYQMLTKRSDRMAQYIECVADRGPDEVIYDGMLMATGDDELACAAANIINGLSWPRGVPDPNHPLDGTAIRWPLPNVALGVSVETREYIGRIADLCATPAALRFVSCEPLLAPLQVEYDLACWAQCQKCGGSGSLPVHGGGVICDACDGITTVAAYPKVDQLIIGCESHGPKLGRLSVDGTATPKTWLGWAEREASNATAVGVRVFVKQIPGPDGQLLHSRTVLDNPDHPELRHWPQALRSWQMLPWESHQ